MENTAIHPAIEAYALLFESTFNRFMTTLGHVPDDKLNYKPSETAKSALEIAAHVAIANLGFAAIIAQQPMHDNPMQWVEEQSRAIDSREKAEAALVQGFKAAHAAILAADPNRMEETVPGPIPGTLRFYLGLCARHNSTHAGQIDYLQTIWGDTEFHV